MVAETHAEVQQVRGPYVVLTDTFMLELVAVNQPLDPETEDSPLHAGEKVIV
jgi:hypothetical protein